MACPFFSQTDSTCGVYAYRNSVCSSFFCVNDHGPVGTDMWSSLQALLGNAELSAAQWAMGEAGLTWPAQVQRMAELSSDLDALSTPDGGWTSEALSLLWGDWRGREEDFYAACVGALRSHRSNLAEILATWQLTDAVVFEVAMRDWIPAAHRSVIAPIAEPGLEHVPLDDLWYGLQLELRNLWALPFGERLTWREGITLRSPDGRLPLLIGERHEVVGASARFWLSQDELALYSLFKDHRVLDASVLDSPEAVALSDARAFLSELMRRGLLIKS
jgi:hypothetical protein